MLPDLIFLLYFPCSADRERDWPPYKAVLSVGNQYAGCKKQQEQDQPGKVVHHAGGEQAQKRNIFFPVPVRALEFGLARRVRPSRPASARSFSTLRLNLLTHGTPPAFCDGVIVHILYRQPSSSQPRVYGVMLAYR